MSIITTNRPWQDSRSAGLEVDGVDGGRRPDICCRLAAAALLAPALPLLAVSIALIRLTSWGPGVFRQTRVGLGGRPFTMYKLRTMRLDAEAATGPVWTQENDPRV